MSGALCRKDRVTINRRWILCLVSYCLMLSAPVARATNAEDALRAQLAQGLARGMPSISVAIATRQGVIWSDAVGYAD